ncbi:MAG: type III polyketide synthase, partial [Thermodesulfobacteriota bacterium]
PDKLGTSRKILRDFGNMSSATVLFVLKDMLDGINGHHEPSLVFSMAFGPGVTMEAGLLKTHSPASQS